MRVINGNVSATNHGTLIVSWSNAPGPVDVMKSFAQESGFSKVYTSDGIESSWEDVDKNYDPNRVSYYRLVSGADDSKIVFLKDGYDGVIDTMLYAEKILNKYYQGDPFYLLKVTKSGTRCPNCWDKFRDEAMIHDCPVCKSTGWTQGTYEKMDVFVSVSADTVASPIIPEGENKSGIISGRMSNYPLIDTGDIFISKSDNVRYIAVGEITRTKIPVQAKSKNGTSHSQVVSQMMTLRELERDHAYYGIEVEFD